MRLMWIVLAGCWTTSRPSPPPPPVPTVAKTSQLPCGVDKVDDLITFEDRAGTCTVIADGAFRDVMEHGRLVLRSGEAKPVTAYDRRIEGPHGIRVGMTTAELTARVPAYRLMTCSAFGDALHCELRVPGKPKPCEAFKDPDAVEPIYVWFALPDELRDTDAVDLAGLLGSHRISGVVLAMPC